MTWLITIWKLVQCGYFVSQDLATASQVQKKKHCGMVRCCDMKFTLWKNILQNTKKVLKSAFLVS